MTRVGRRRRVLNEEVRAAGKIVGQSPPALREQSSDAPRYGEQASIENHPQVTDFVPRRYRTIMMVVFVGMICAAGVELSVRHADQLAAVLPTVGRAEIEDVIAGRFMAWCSAVVLLLTAAYARVVFMLGRHRIDDYRGRYRIWRIATWAAIGLSMNAVVGLHEPFARILGSWTGWNMLANQSGWWLLGAVLVGGWIMVRLALDLAPCRIALATIFLSLTCYLAAGVAAAGWWPPEWLGVWSGMVVRTLPLVGNVLLLAAIMFNARYVVLDVQGLIQIPKRSSSRKTHADAVALSQTDNAGKQAERTAARKRPSQVTQKAEPVVEKSNATSTTGWIDGTKSDSGMSSEKPRRMSKSEKKRLRKLKARRAA